MSNFNKISGQRGTLLVEAIAMLGLIALVTPTLYKKSAERLQEIQDINIASQARTMYNIVETFMKTNYGSLVSDTESAPGSTLVVSYNKGECPADVAAANCFTAEGYSAFVPFGYTPGDLKNYGEPRVYIHNDNSSLVTYIVFPALSSSDLGKKRAARVASLVGANGGVVSPPLSGGGSSEIYGTGGAWYLDSSMISAINMKTDYEENSLVVTSPEPVNMSNVDSEKFLYRVPPENGEADAFHNTMVTDLYLGGNDDTESQWRTRARGYFSIFNVRKLTLNTDCKYGGSGLNCSPDVADLYIGKPEATAVPNNDPTVGINDHNAITEGNTGAAWIYGNFAALNESFRLFREGDASASVDRLNGHDVMEFVRNTSAEEGETANEYSVFRVETGNGEDGALHTANARISLMNDFMQVFESGSSSMASGSYELTLGHSSLVGGEDGFMHAYTDGSTQVLRLSSPQGFDSDNADKLITMINHSGGTVYINGGASSDVHMDTIINDSGGKIEAGHRGSWLLTGNVGSSSFVQILNGSDLAEDGDAREFVVGASTELDNGAMIYGNSSRVSMREGRLRVHNVTVNESTAVGGVRMLQDIYGGDNSLIPTELTGETAILSKYTDILGTTHMGINSISQDSATVGDIVYQRPDWTLTVAGNAWIDDLLYAQRAWINNAGVKELHAGFSSFAEYQTNPHTGWLDVYDDRFIVRDRERASGADGYDDSTNVMIYADSSEIILRDLQGTGLHMTQNTARLGNDANYLFVDSPENEDHAINVVGSTLASVYTTDSSDVGVVNLQKDALQLFGQPQGTTDYGNRIEARAQEFMIQTTGDTQDSTTAQFYATNDGIRTRYVDFSVEDDNSSAVFKVMPNVGTGSSDANVQVHGTLHVNDNEVIHVASDISNRAGEEGEDHAMLEVDPQYVQIWANRNSSYASRLVPPEGDPYYAMLKVNPTDIGGGSSSIDDTENASIYIRRGAIELEPSASGLFADSSAADSGVGYIKANRLVSDTGLRVPNPTAIDHSGYEHKEAYDQYMVNPAYTSVMHDIKLTTRGGARLSDALPDFVLKGVYNLVNNCTEGEHSVRCNGTDMGRWASPYIGMIPYASCPPGYRNMATVVPISFNMGQAGQLIEANKLISGTAGGNGFVVNPYPRQAQVVAAAGNAGNITYPGMGRVEGFTSYHMAVIENGFTSSADVQIQKHPEGWFRGFSAKYEDATQSTTVSDLTTISSAANPYENFQPYQFAENGNDWKVVAEPLYFQQNTWLKTSVDPGDNGWEAYMGFIYPTNVWSGGDTSTIRSNYNEQGYNDEGSGGAVVDNYAWNVFPIPTNTIEGHATVYCYFDRNNFRGWGDLIDQRDARDLLQENGEFDRYNKNSGRNSETGYVQRLNDPSLKYSDPW